MSGAGLLACLWSFYIFGDISAPCGHHPFGIVHCPARRRNILAHGASRGEEVGRPPSPGTGRNSMPHSFASLLVHVVFSTKDRVSDLSPGLAARPFPYMAGIVKERKGVPLIINGLPHPGLPSPEAGQEARPTHARAMETRSIPLQQRYSKRRIILCS